MKKTFLLLLMAACAFQGHAIENTQSQEKGSQKIQKLYRYRVTFTDKKDCGFSVRHPEKFLSGKSIERRKRYGLKVDAHDLPITPKYLQQLEGLGLRVFNKSKWNNTAVVETADTVRMQQVRKFPFVKHIRCVWEGPDSIVSAAEQMPRKEELSNRCDTTLADPYGFAADQVRMLGVDCLHKAGYRGKGITIAVIDGGFHNADIIPGLKNVNILGTRNFVRPGKSVYEELEHGMMVLSCMAANTTGTLIGTAPEASYYLLQSEDGDSEQLIEEDNWCAALEYADSLGCDLVTSSLGYYRFDHDYMSHKYRDLDGKTALNSRSASLAASRGIVLLNSAGNSGDEPWKKIGFPADATDMLAVGAVDAGKVNSNFSSLGNAADGRIKPDVMAMGVFSSVYDTDGMVTFVNGTSFSCPITCGAVACLVQACPDKRPVEIIEAVKQSGDNAAHPDNVFGYGIPDLEKALKLLKRK